MKRDTYTCTRIIPTLACGLALLAGTSGCRAVLENGYKPFVKLGLVDEEIVKQNLELYDQRFSKDYKHLPQGNKGMVPDLIIGLPAAIVRGR